jgi:hypothetical protein
MKTPPNLPERILQPPAKEVGAIDRLVVFAAGRAMS